MKTILVFLLFFISLSAPAQYFYNDIIGTLELNRQMKKYRDQKVKTVSATGYDHRGAKAGNFSELQEVRGNILKISTITGLDKVVAYHQFDDQSRIVNIRDSSAALQSSTTYLYDPNGRIIEIRNTTTDSANDFSQSEIHRWIYDGNGKPQKMWRTINTNDSIEIRFTPDESGNTGDEKTYRRGIETGTVYYYYDDAGRLTDIVRYNTKAKKLLPDMLFEYDEKGRVIQKITTTSSLTLGYLIWRYIFDEKGLKSKEALFNDQKELTGKIEYSYTFNQ